MTPTWPQAARELKNELASRGGRHCLMTASPSAEEVVEALTSALGVPSVPVGRLLTNEPEPLAQEAVESVLSDAMVLVDCEILFTPVLEVDPLALFRRLARSGPRIVLWPGRIKDGRALYSEPGRADHYDRPLRDAVVLRPRAVRFPDEVPYTEERIPA